MPKHIKPIKDMMADNFTKLNGKTIVPSDFTVGTPSNYGDGTTVATITAATTGNIANGGSAQMNWKRIALQDLVNALPSNTIPVVTKGATLYDCLAAINQSTGWDFTSDDLDAVTLAWPANNGNLSVIIKAKDASLRYTGAATVILNPVKYLLSDLLPDNVYPGVLVNSTKELLVEEFQKINDIKLINGYFSISIPKNSSDTSKGPREIILTAVQGAGGYLGTHSLYFTQVWDDNTMLRNTSLPGFVTLYTSQYSTDWGAVNAFQVSAGSWASTRQATTVPQSIGVEYPTAKRLTGYMLKNHSQAGTTHATPRAWTIQGSNDGVRWELVHEVTNSLNTVPSDERNFTFATAKDYTSFRMHITENSLEGTSYPTVVHVNQLDFHFQA